MQTTNIRQGTPDDVGAVLQLIKELAAYEKALEEVQINKAQLLADGFGEKPLFGLLVVEVEQTIVGFALYFYRYSTWKGKLLYLEDLYLKPEARQQQLGTRLFEALTQIARKEKCQRIVWQVLEWNEPAIKFYEKIGAKFDGEWVNAYLRV